MLISMWTNAVMCRVNVQNALRRLQRRLSVACTIHWWHCQSLPGPDGPIPPQHAGSSSTSVIRWCLYTCSCRYPTLHSRRGSDPDKTRSWLSYQDCEPCAADRYPTTIDAAGSVNLTQYSLNSTQRPVFISKHSQYFGCSIELLISYHFYRVLMF